MTSIVYVMKPSEPTNGSTLAAGPTWQGVPRMLPHCFQCESIAASKQ